MYVCSPKIYKLVPLAFEFHNSKLSHSTCVPREASNHFTCIDSFNPQNNPMNHYPHFTNKKTGSGRWSNLPRFTQILTGRAGTWTQIAWLQYPNLAKHVMLPLILLASWSEFPPTFIALHWTLTYSRWTDILQRSGDSLALRPASTEDNGLIFLLEDVVSAKHALDSRKSLCSVPVTHW